ncbi:MAG TPA: TIM barrel protein [Alphaproteobacteria bacterium]|nr:TIM barrel protein [Alphaproteobacteria bacterium]
MLRSIATVSLSGTLEEKLQAAAAARFDAVEIFENDFICYDGSARQVQALAADLGLKIALYQPFRDFEGVSDEQFRRNLDRAERKFDVMEEMGAALMLVCSNATLHAIDDDARAAAQLFALADRAAARGLRIGYEALAWGTRVNTYGRAWSIVSRAAHPHLGLILDSFHTLAIADPVAGIADIPGDRIFFVQLADAPRLKMDVLMHSRHFRCFPGQGELDVAAFLVEVVRAGYAGPISLEVFNDEFRATPTRPTAVDAMRSLLFLEEQVRARLTKGGQEAERAVHRVELFDPPPVPTLNGLAFLEFAVDGATSASLGGTLERLGFQRFGRHRSKAVALYRQGDVNLVLNAEPNSFAHSYFLMHGPSICAIALRAADEFQALNRAEALGCSRFEGRVGPNERTIPAIRSLDGSLIYFVPNRPDAADPLEADFISDEAPAAPSAGLAAVDHVAQALPAGQFDSWVLFYRAVLGLEPDDVWVLADPHGLVRSRAVASANRSVRFPLNISASRNTVTARSISAFAGAGVHHIAFRTDDILAMAARCRANGVPLLPIPANYYDDLAIRHELAPDLLDRLARNGILYDRNAGGEYLHLYTEPFEDRFFFEVVQRIGGYDLYGAVNAPVRMAAQTRRLAPVIGELMALR